MLVLNKKKKKKKKTTTHLVGWSVGRSQEDLRSAEYYNNKTKQHSRLLAITFVAILSRAWPQGRIDDDGVRLCFLNSHPSPVGSRKDGNYRLRRLNMLRLFWPRRALLHTNNWIKTQHRRRIEFLKKNEQEVQEVWTPGRVTSSRCMSERVALCCVVLLWCWRNIRTRFII